MVSFTGRVWDIYRNDGEHAVEGDVWLQAKLDNIGRAAVAGKHANHGYSGWFTGLVQAEGGRRRFLSWRIMFPDLQNGYEKQADKSITIFRIEECIRALGHMRIVKTKGGWRFEDEVEADRLIASHWKAWNAPPPGMTREKAQEIADRLNNQARRLTHRRYTADQILARPESEIDKRMRLRGGPTLAIGSSGD